MNLSELKHKDIIVIKPGCISSNDTCLINIKKLMFIRDVSNKYHTIGLIEANILEGYTYPMGNSIQRVGKGMNVYIYVGVVERIENSKDNYSLW